MEGIRDDVGFIGDEGAAGCTYHQDDDHPSPETQYVDVVLVLIHYSLLRTRVLEPSVLTIIRLYESALGFCRVSIRGRIFCSDFGAPMLIGPRPLRRLASSAQLGRGLPTSDWPSLFV